MDTRKIKREDLQDLAKIGGDLLKRTVVSGIEVIKDVGAELPKEASQLLAKGKEEILKGLSKEMAQSLVSFTIDRFFAAVREHRLEVSISLAIRRRDDASGGSAKERSARERETTTGGAGGSRAAAGGAERSSRGHAGSRSSAHGRS